MKYQELDSRTSLNGSRSTKHLILVKRPKGVVKVKVQVG